VLQALLIIFTRYSTHLAPNGLPSYKKICNNNNNSNKNKTLGPLLDEAHSISPKKSHALHNQCTGSCVLVLTYFHGNSAFQCNVPCQHIHSFQVHILATPDIISTLANFKTLGMKYQGKIIIIIISEKY